MTRCATCPFAGKTIGSRGPETARICLVGEAPGNQELISGKPFIGPSGRLLTESLSEVGININECFITNSLSCKPPNGTKIPRAAINSCAPRLMHELSAAHRDIVISVGGTALRALTGFDLSILERRGHVFDHPTISAPVLPTVHPAAILHGASGLLPLFKTDLEIAAQIARGNRRDPGITRYAVIESDAEVDRALRGLMHCTELAADIETGNLLWNTPVLCIGIAWAKNKVLVFPWSVVLKHHARFKELFENPRIKKTFHNGKFDTSHMARYGFDVKLSDDTMLASYMLNEEGTHGLKQLAAIELGASQWTDDLNTILGVNKQNSDEKIRVSFQAVPREVLHKYLAADCDSTFQLKPILIERLQTDQRLYRAYKNIMIAGSNFLRKVEDYGMWVDVDRLAELRTDLETRTDALRAELRTMVSEYTNGEMTDYNPSSPKQVYHVLYNVLRLAPTEDEAQYFTGTTQRADLERLDPHPFIDKQILYKKLLKAKSTYVEGVDRGRDENNRIHPLFKQHGAVTGRGSSGDSKNLRPPTQNTTKFDPKQDPNAVNVRSVYSAPPGRTLIEADYSQGELRILGALSKDPLLIEVYREGRDLHSEVAALIFGPNFTDTQRRDAKETNFGTVYGLEAKNLAKRRKIPLSLAEKIQSDWRNIFKVAWRYLQWLASHPQKGLPVRSPLGRLRRFPFVPREEMHHAMNQAKNAPIQNTLSDFTLLSGVYTHEQLLEWDAHVINLIHDALIIECPDDPDTIERVKQYVNSVMTEIPRKILGDTIPFVVDFHVGRNWGLMGGK